VDACFDVAVGTVALCCDLEWEPLPVVEVACAKVVAVDGEGVVRVESVKAEGALFAICAFGGDDAAEEMAVGIAVVPAGVEGSGNVAHV